MCLRSKQMRIVVLTMVACGGVAVWLIWDRSHRFNSHQTAALQALERRDFGKARFELQACLAINPDDLVVRLLAAQAARRQGKVDDALEDLDVYERGGGSAEALANERNLLRIQLGEGEGVDEDVLLAACAERPLTVETALTLEAIIEGNLRSVARGAWTLAAAERALVLWSKRPGRVDQLKDGVGERIHMIAQEPAQAMDELRQALELDPDHFDARLQLALTLSQTEPHESVGHLRKLRKRAPEDVQILFFLGVGLGGLGQLSEARQLLDQALAYNPDHIPALIERGLIALDENQLDDAERLLRQAVQKAPRAMDAHLALSRCLREAGKIKDSNFFHERFMQLEQEHRQRREEAVRIYRSAVEPQRK